MGSLLGSRPPWEKKVCEILSYQKKRAGSGDTLVITATVGSQNKRVTVHADLGKKQDTK
jgi:hypothetical protein